jgi:hypothetical protein
MHSLSSSISNATSIMRILALASRSARIFFWNSTAIVPATGAPVCVTTWGLWWALGDCHGRNGLPAASAFSRMRRSVLARFFAFRAGPAVALARLLPALLVLSEASVPWCSGSDSPPPSDSASEYTTVAVSTVPAAAPIVEGAPGSMAIS